ncbi:MAG: hypothetical protein PHP93_00410 [Kiritimatiellales bacterium]|nr:hypothetical protein [Kiritimatiellales bacterium]
MKRIITLVCLSAAASHAQNTALTLYNQNFAVVREQIELKLNKGETQVAFSEITAHAEPDSVILRSLSQKNTLRILEQNYRADPISQNLLLNYFQGREIDFLSETNLIKGKIIRGGHAVSRYPDPIPQEEPIIEVDGQLRFSLPGQPIFPTLGNDSILKPTFNWLLHSDREGKTDAELCYVSGGMSWEADYNIVAPEKGDTVDVIGWVTMNNQSGRTFENAKIKLMAGDVEKIKPNGNSPRRLMKAASSYADREEPAVSEKAFDEYHLYALGRTTTLRDRETKQVEFLRAANVESQTVYIYDGLQIDPNRYRGWNWANIRQERDYGTQCNPKVWVMREFKNTKENGLGIPLPKGRARFYRRDTDGQLEFTGENLIDHTPKDETVRLFTGNAFDLVGERTRTDYQIDTSKNWIDESFEIKVRNRKEKDAAEIRVVEHLYRALTWNISASSDLQNKTSSDTMEFRVTLQPGEEKVITYTVHYSW